MDSQDILTLEEVAELLKVSVRTIISWVEKEGFPGGKLGTSWRFMRSDVEKWVIERVSSRDVNVDASIALQKYFSVNNIFLKEFSCQKDVFEFLVQRAASDLKLNGDDLLEKVWQREALMSTGIGCSIGLPHIRLPELQKIHVYVAFSQTPIIDYMTMDDKPVHVVAFIAAGTNVQVEYLKFLSIFTGILKNRETRERLLGCRTVQCIHTEMLALHQVA